jgi:hypothetical protein
VDLRTREFPESSIFNKFLELGFEISNSAKSEYIIFINHNTKAYKEYIKFGGSKEKTVLIRTEPKCVFPYQYRKVCEEKYGKVISPGMVDLALNDPCQFNWPYIYESNPNLTFQTDESLRNILSKLKTFEANEVANWDNRTIDVSMVLSNKVSPISDSNYALRRQLAKIFPDDTLLVYGLLWNETLSKKLKHRVATLIFSVRHRTIPNLKSVYGELLTHYSAARGVVDDKHRILRQSKFSLVAENSNHGLSGRLFDCLIAGSIPVFFGPRLADAKIPSEVGIEWNEDIKILPDFLMQIDKHTVSSLLSAGREFILSDYFYQKWEAGNVNNAIAREIIAHWEFSDQKVFLKYDKSNQSENSAFGD